MFIPLLLLYMALFCLFLTTETPEPPSPPEPVIHTGDVQVLLEWETNDDLDLHVTDPFGETIYFQHNHSESGGELDVDANASRISPHPKENIYWPEGGAPTGEYTVNVVLYVHRTQVPVHYQVSVKHGDVTDFYDGELSGHGERKEICVFNLN